MREFNFSHMINDRIEELIRKLCNGNSSLFSRKIGVTPSVITNITGQRKGKPSFEVIEKIASAFAEINVRWLITGEGDMLHWVIKPISANETTLQLVTTIASQAETIGALKKEVEVLQDRIQKLQPDVSNSKDEDVPNAGDAVAV